MTPKQGRGTITVAGSDGGDVTTGLQFTESGGTVNRSTPPVFPVGDLTPGAAYTWTASADAYETRSLTYTPVPNDNFASTLTLSPTAKVTVNVTSPAPLTNLQLIVSPNTANDTVRVTGPTSGGSFTVTGLLTGFTYAFSVAADHHQAATPVNYTAVSGDVHTIPIALVPRPSTVAITVNGGPSDPAAVTVSASPAAGTPVRSGNVWTFTITTAGTYTFTASATDFDSASTPAIAVGIDQSLSPTPLNLSATPPRGLTPWLGPAPAYLCRHRSGTMAVSRR